MNPVDAGLVLGGLIAPFVINILKQPGWSRTMKLWLSMGVSVVLGILALYATGGLTLAPWDNPVEFLTAVLASGSEVLGIATVVYKFFLEKANIPEH